MLNTRSTVAALVFACFVSAANADVMLPVALNGGAGIRSVTSIDAIEVAPSYAWTLDLSAMAGAGLTGSLFGMPFSMPLYGANPADLFMAGSYAGSLPANLITRSFSFTDLGAVTPAYDFSVALNLLADRTLQTTVTVTGMGSFMPGGIIPQNPVMIPVSSVNVGGIATVTAVPAPGAIALAAIGGVVALIRRRVTA